MVILETCCYSMECAHTTQQDGAGRIELCSAPKEEGLAPSLSILRPVRQHILAPVNPVIHLRGGDFCYTGGEFAAMPDGVTMVRELGLPGLVTGTLDMDSNINMPHVEKIMIATGSLQATSYRAFDMCANPLNALKKLVDLGVARILTSRRKLDVVQSLTGIIELIAQPGAPIIMIGAGVRASNLSLFLDAEVQEVHSSAGVWLASPVRYRNSELSMPSDAQADEYSRYAVDRTTIVEMEAIITHHQAN